MIFVVFLSFFLKKKEGAMINFEAAASFLEIWIECSRVCGVKPLTMRTLLPCVERKAVRLGSAPARKVQFKR